MTDLKPLFDEGVLTPGKPLIIAGPCSAETEQQVLDAAHGLKAAGVKVFRAGIWKPRTKPGGFEGVGARGLAWLRRVKEETGLLTATEVANRSHAEQALAAGVDLLWIGARTSANPFAVQEVADAIAAYGALDTPLLVKNPVNPDLELWIGALQRFYNAGLRRLGAIHRGFSAYGKHVWRNPPQWHIPIELRLRLPNLPIICDPSHIGGRRELIAPLSQQALDMGFDGLIIESHCHPDEAWSDAAQQLTPECLNLVLDALVVRGGDPHTTESLSQLRAQIDQADRELLEVLARRLDVCRQIGRYKKEHGMQVVQASRYNDIIKERVGLATQMGIGEDFMRAVLLAIHDESVRQQVQILSEK